MDETIEKPPLERVIAILGTAERLARTLNITPQAVSRWRRTQVPAERVLDVERAVEGRVSRHELRPDVFGLHAESSPQCASSA